MRLSALAALCGVIFVLHGEVVAASAGSCLAPEIVSNIKQRTENPSCAARGNGSVAALDATTLVAAAIGLITVVWILPRSIKMLLAVLVHVVGLGAIGVLVFFDTKYPDLVADNSIDIDAYTCTKASMLDRAKLAITHLVVIGNRSKAEHGIELGMVESPYVKGLIVSGSKSTMGEEAKPLVLGGGEDKKKPVVVGTIRMGFGHHRIAYAVSSWGLKSNADTLFHDFLAVKSEESALIHHLDEVYSTASRLASEIGGPVELLWGLIMRSGDESALRVTNQMAEQIRPLLWDIPKDTPIIATHSMVGHTAVAAGFKHVINLVIDNYPQWFLIVPGAINLVQGPKNFATFLRMGVPDHQLRIAGHWCPAQLVDHIEEDCNRRIQRRNDKKPLRLLIPVGGAGAQKKFVTGFLENLKEELHTGSVQVLLNSGDHKHMRAAFEETLSAIGIATKDYTLVNDIQGVYSFVDSLMGGAEPAHSVTLFAFDDYFPAVATTDILARVADVLCSKPSELAFYPVPKLNIRRVGDHEAYSAVRSAELGDGSPEVREVADAGEWVRLMGRSPALLTDISRSILAQHSQGVYNGAKEAMRLALELGSSE